MRGDEPRRAASVLLLGGPPEDPEILLVKRGEDRSFFPGYRAFVGGGLDPEDGDPTTEAAFRHAALRETFEEAGVLVTRDPLPKPARVAEARAKLLANERSLAEVASDLGVEPDPSLLAPAGRLLTPAFVPIRYDTRFYVTWLPEGQEAEIRVGELERGDWLRPRDFLAAWDRLEMHISPPTLLYLRALAAHGVEDGTMHLAALDTSEDGGGREPYIEVHPGIRFLPLRTPTLPPHTATNTYVLGSDRLVVVDPGTPEPKERERLEVLLDTMVQAGAEVDRVVLTHHHPDHVASAAALRDRYDAPIAAHPWTAEALAGEVPVDELLEDGDELDLGTWAPTGQPWTVQALHTPGHAPGHLALRDTRWNALVVGDLVAGFGTIRVAPPEGDMAAYVASLTRLIALDPAIVLPAHGPFARHATILQRTLDHRLMREGKVVAALGPEPQSVEALLATVYDDTPPELWGLAEGSLVAHLGKLEVEGRAAETGDGWGRPKAGLK